MLIGSYEIELDAQGRVTVPQAWWGELAGGAVLTRGVERCLWVFPRERFAKIVQGLELSFGRRDARMLFRLLYAPAQEAEWDERGRFLVPSSLRDYAGLERRGLMVGLGSRLEVWEPSKWQEMDRQVMSQAEEAAERLAHILEQSGH